MFVDRVYSLCVELSFLGDVQPFVTGQLQVSVRSVGVSRGQKYFLITIPVSTVESCASHLLRLFFSWRSFSAT